MALQRLTDIAYPLRVKAAESKYFCHVQKVNCRKTAREAALGRAAAKMIEII